jgi:hypothetical protein
MFKCKDNDTVWKDCFNFKNNLSGFVNTQLLCININIQRKIRTRDLSCPIRKKHVLMVAAGDVVCVQCK